MECHRCGCDVNAVHETKSVPTGPVNAWIGQATELILIALCPVCAQCWRGSVGFIIRVILAAIAGIALYRLIWALLR